MRKFDKRVLEILKENGNPMNVPELITAVQTSKGEKVAGSVQRSLHKLKNDGYVAEGHRSFGRNRKVFYLKDGVNVK